MPNYNIVVDTSNFKPFTYKDLMAPYEVYAKDYDAIQDKLDKVMEDYSGLPDLPEGQYRDTLNAYMEDLRNASDSFSRGMTSANATELLKLFRRGKQDITPIKKGVENYNEAIDMYNKLGPDAIYDKPKLEDYIGAKGQKLEMKYLSRSGIMKEAADFYAGLNEALKGDPTFKHVAGAAGYLLQQNKGYDPKHIIDAMSSRLEDATQKQSLAEIRNYFDSIDTSGMSGETKQKVWDAMTTGLMSAVKNDSSLIPDKNYHSPWEIEDRARKQAAEEASMEESGRKWNPTTKQWEYDEELHKQSIERRTRALGVENTPTFEDPNNSNVVWKKVDKQYIAIDKTTGQPANTEYTIGGITYRGVIPANVVERSNTSKSSSATISNTGIVYQSDGTPRTAPIDLDKDQNVSELSDATKDLLQSCTSYEEYQKKATKSDSSSVRASLKYINKDNFSIAKKKGIKFRKTTVGQRTIYELVLPENITEASEEEQEVEVSSQVSALMGGGVSTSWQSGFMPNGGAPQI